MSPESVALFTNAGASLLASLVMYTIWITVIPMLEGDKKKKRLNLLRRREKHFVKTAFQICKNRRV